MNTHKERTIVDYARLKYPRLVPLEAVLQYAAATFHSLDGLPEAQRAGAQRLGRDQAVRGLMLLGLTRDEATRRAKWIEDGEIGTTEDTKYTEVKP